MVVEPGCALTQAREQRIARGGELDQVDPAVVRVAASADDAARFHRIEVLSEGRALNPDGRGELALVWQLSAFQGDEDQPLSNIDTDDFDWGIAINIRGTFLGMKYQIPAMLAGDGGAIVNMASLAGLNGTANLAAYVAGKAGIIGPSKVAALDYADQDIRVNVVAPGPILTHHLEQAGPEAQRQAALSTPMRRTGTPAEVAQAVLWLCSPQSSFINGVVIRIDGGQSAGTKPPKMNRPGQPMTSQPEPAKPNRT